MQIQKTVTLSVTEAEYSAIMEVCCEILFVREILFFMGFDVKSPIQMQDDNIGAILLLENIFLFQRTKHIDIRHNFIRC